VSDNIEGELWLKLLRKLRTERDPALGKSVTAKSCKVTDARKLMEQIVDEVLA